MNRTGGTESGADGNNKQEQLLLTPLYYSQGHPLPRAQPPTLHSPSVNNSHFPPRRLEGLFYPFPRRKPHFAVSLTEAKSLLPVNNVLTKLGYTGCPVMSLQYSRK